MVEVIRKVHARGKYISQELATHLAEHLWDERLTDRELDVMRLIVAGNCNHAIADCLLSSKETVEAQLSTSLKVGRRESGGGGHNRLTPRADADLALIQPRITISLSRALHFRRRGTSRPFLDINGVLRRAGRRCGIRQFGFEKRLDENPNARA